MLLRDLLLKMADECGSTEIGRSYELVLKRKIRAITGVRAKASGLATTLPPLSAIKDRYGYNSHTGNLLRYLKTGRVNVAGHRHNSGYIHIEIRVDGKRYRCCAHRLAWLIHYGEPPPLHSLVDHIDGDKGNNAISNLRLVSHKENTAYFADRTGARPEPPWTARKRKEPPQPEG